MSPIHKPTDHASFSPEPDANVVLQAADWYVQLRSAECTAAERASFDAWLAQDASHAVAYERIANMWHQLDGVSHKPALHALEQVLGPEFKPVGSKLSAKAIAMGISLVAGVWLGVQSGTAAYLMADYSTAVGEQRVIELPDHTRLTLNTYSAVDIDYSASQRLITLRQGEVLVEVAKDASRPLIVVTSQGTARALGTQFVVKREDNMTQVGVIESVVEACTLKRWFSGVEPSCVTLNAGQGARIENNDISQPLNIDTSAVTGWASGILPVDNQSLAEVLHELERYRHGRIYFGADNIDSLRVSGVLPLNDTNRALEMLEAYLPIDVHYYTPYLVVVKPRPQD